MAFIMSLTSDVDLLRTAFIRTLTNGVFKDLRTALRRTLTNGVRKDSYDRRL